MKKLITLLVCFSLMASLLVAIAPMAIGSGNPEEITGIVPPEISNVLVDGVALVTVQSGTSVVLTATVDDVPTGGSNILGANYTDGFQNWAGNVTMYAFDLAFDSPTEDVNVTIDTTGWSAGNHDLYVYGSDTVPNHNDTSALFASIFIDDTGPDLTLTAPANGAPAVAIDQDIVLTFDEPMDTSSVTYTCAPNPGGWLAMGPALWTIGDTVCTLTHNIFVSETPHTFTVDTATDAAGNPFTASVPNPIIFMTEDITAPDLTLTAPANGAPAVAIGEDIVLTFDEAMDTSSVTYTCSPDPLGWPAMGPALWTLGDTVCTLTHNAFAGDTLHTFTVTAATDAAGNPFTASVPNPFTFTTEDVTPPVVQNLTWDPLNHISVNNPIQIDFQVYEANLKGAGVIIAKPSGGNVTLDNYTNIFEDYTDEADLEQNQTNLEEYNATMTWNTRCPADITNNTIHGYLSNSSTTKEFDQYIDASYWEDATPPSRYTGVNIYFTNETYNETTGYPDGEKANLQFNESSGSVFGLWINGSGQEEWLNETNINNGTYHDNGTVQLRISVFSINIATGALVADQVDAPFGKIIDLVDAVFVTDNLVPDGNYWIVTYGEDISDNLGFNMSDDSFSVDNTPPTIVLDSPADNAIIQNGTEIELTITDDNLDLVTYSVNSATAVNLTTPYDIDTTGWADGEYTIEVLATDLAQNDATAEYDFTIDSTLPIIVLNSPDEDGRITPGTTIDFMVTDTNLDTVVYSVDGGTLLNFTAPYDIDTTGWADDTYTIMVQATDLAGNIAVESYDFTIDGTAPTVVSVVPADDATGVAPDTTIVITFSEAMNNVSVQNAISTTPTITSLGYSWNTANTVLTLTPPADLAQNTEFTILVGTGAEDVAGNNLAAGYTTSFTTWIDTDDDGIPDDTDTDDDGDGFLDVWETFLGTDPLDAADMPLDTDDDGIPNGNANNTETWMDLDDDGDLVPDALDLDPLDPNVGLEELVDDVADYLLMIIAIVVILVIVGVLAFVMLMRKRGKPEPPAAVEAEPPIEEEAPTVEAEPPIEEEAPMEEDVGPPETLEASEPTEQSSVE